MNSWLIMITHGLMIVIDDGELMIDNDGDLMGNCSLMVDDVV